MNQTERNILSIRPLGCSEDKRIEKGAKRCVAIYTSQKNGPLGKYDTIVARFEGGREVEIPRFGVEIELQEVEHP